MLRYFTTGESHGEALVACIAGLQAGLDVDQAFLDHELWRRQQGFGRGGRMKIERDHAHILSGVRHGKTIGSPISIQLANNDWKNWTEALPVDPGDPGKHKRDPRSEEHPSELQSHLNLVFRLLLENKKLTTQDIIAT